MITQEFKSKVTQALINYTSKETGGTQDMIVEQVAVQSGFKINKAYVSQIKNGKYFLSDSEIDDKYFIAIGKLFNISATEKVWKTVKTSNYLKIHNHCEEARYRGSVISIVGKTATGKTHAVKEYFLQHAINAKENPTFMLRCKARFNKRSFISALAKAVHVPSGGNVDVICEAIVNKLSRTENALLIIDEAEHMSPKMLELLKDIYDDLESCGIVVVVHQNRLNQLYNQVSRGSGCTEQIWRRFFEDYREVLNLESEDIAFVIQELGLDNNKWLHKSAVNWLLTESEINNYSLFKKYIETAYTRCQLTDQVITKQVLKDLIPKKEMQIEY